MLGSRSDAGLILAIVPIPVQSAFRRRSQHITLTAVHHVTKKSDSPALATIASLEAGSNAGCRSGSRTASSSDEDLVVFGQEYRIVHACQGAKRILYDPSGS